MVGNYLRNNVTTKTCMDKINYRIMSINEFWSGSWGRAGCSRVSPQVPGKSVKKNITKVNNKVINTHLIIIATGIHSRITWK